MSPSRTAESRDRPPVRRHHRRRHGAAVVHPADRRTTSAPRAPPLSSPARWASTRRWSCTPSRWAPTSPSSSSTAGCTTSSTSTRSRWSSATTRCSTPKEVNAAIKTRLRRQLVVVGACIGTDAHTVGIDAILNIKGFAGEKGLEYYREIKVVNLGAQVLGARAGRAAPGPSSADAVLVSQVVTQRDAHLHNTREMSAAFREAYPAGKRPLLVVGGPRFDETTAGELGVDRIFGQGTTPGEVASLPRARASSHRPRPSRHRDEPDAPDPRLGARPSSHRRYVPVLATPTTPATSSTAPTASACSATSPPRCASAPTATRGCSPSYSDVQFLAPVRAGDVARGHAPTVVRVGPAQPGAAPSRPAWSCRGRAGARGRAPREVLDAAAGGHHGARGTVVVPPSGPGRHAVDAR